MTDPFQDFAKNLSSPADTHFEITPSDSSDVPVRPRALYCRSAGDVALQDGSGQVLTYTVAAGEVLLFRAARVLATGTTATVYGWL